MDNFQIPPVSQTSLYKIEAEALVNMVSVGRLALHLAVRAIGLLIREEKDQITTRSDNPQPLFQYSPGILEILKHM